MGELLSNRKQTISFNDNRLHNVLKFTHPAYVGSAMFVIHTATYILDILQVDGVEAHIPHPQDMVFLKEGCTSKLSLSTLSSPCGLSRTTNIILTDNP
jgi:hypothetical protein